MKSQTARHAVHLGLFNILIAGLWLSSVGDADWIQFSWKRPTIQKWILLSQDENAPLPQVLARWRVVMASSKGSIVFAAQFDSIYGPAPSHFFGLAVQRANALDCAPSSSRIVLPDWMLLLMGVCGMMFFWRQSAIRSTAGASLICGRCGYDLRASIDRCPECGNEILPLVPGHPQAIRK